MYDRLASGECSFLRQSVLVYEMGGEKYAGNIGVPHTTCLLYTSDAADEMD